MLAQYLLEDSPINLAINSSTHADRLKNQASKKFPSMTIINKVLSIDSVWKTVISEYKFPAGLKFPEFPRYLIYGVVSDNIHNPDITKIILSNLADKNYRNFFSELSIVTGKSITEFDELSSENIDDLD